MAKRAVSARTALLKYLALRLVLIIPTVLILVTVVFFFMRVTGDPITASMGGRLPPEEIERRKELAGYNDPVIVQYGRFLWGLLHGDFGRTTDNQAISDILITYGPATLELVFWALIVAFAVGIPLGRLAARKYNKVADISIRSFAVLFYAAPVFFVALILKLVFSIKLGWFPVSGRASVTVQTILESKVKVNTHIYILNAIQYGKWEYIVDVLRHAVLPGVALGLLTAGVFIRLTRINLLQTMRADYVTAARARGVAENKVVSKHAFRNALIPVVTVMGMQIAMMLGGAILTETTFEWQGLGYWLSQYLLKRDFVAVQGITTAIAVIVAVASFIIDAINAFIDPRVRY
ncbi:MAG: ABC transporter permease [Propionibacteriaceae bacterium]|jgi:peptide/nickel transport system permease protein|nr:ABC transporter permease [Propionibacteriaceae bacterium]